MLPVGAADPVAGRVAVNVYAAPTTGGLGETASVPVGVAFTTAIVTGAGEVLAEKLPVGV
jgi:hypothetical protein